MTHDTTTSFADLGLADPVLRAIEDAGYEAPSPIQAEAIPPLLAGRDLLGQAQTGTGKTGAFALPILSRLDLALARPQALVLTPTRELAIQVAEAMQTYARRLEGFHVLPVYGGQEMGSQLRALSRGVHAVVGTPGRILDHLRRGTLDLTHLTTVVLDEADEMLRMGFLEDVKEILGHAGDTTQVALFSATLPAAIRDVARERLRNPVEIRIQTKTATVATVRQRYWPVVGVHKLDALTRILEAEEFDAMLVFVRTKTATVELAEKLEARGFASAPLNGDMNQVLRERTVDRLKRGLLDIVVATDIAARGLHVERISHVINYDVPYDVEAYVHRIGRTARAGREGCAILFLGQRERRMLHAIERATRQPIERMQLPTREEVADRRVRSFKRTLAEVLVNEDLTRFERLVTDIGAEQGVEIERLAAALAFLAQGKGASVSTKAEAGRKAPARSEGAAAAAKLPPPVAAQPAVAEPRASRPQADTGAASPVAKAPASDTAKPSRPVPAPRPAPRAAVDTRPPRGPAASGAATVRRDEDRSAGPRQARREPASSTPEPGKCRYRIEVGREHGVQPAHIVGAIANEAGLEGRHIGPIRIFSTFSTVDLPEGMPKATYQLLRKVRVCERPLAITLLGGSPDDRPPRAPRARPAGGAARPSRPRKSAPSGRGPARRPHPSRG